MTEISEFVDKVHKILSSFGYKYTFTRTTSSDDYIWTLDFDTNKGTNPSQFSVCVFNGILKYEHKDKDKVGFYYSSVLYHFSPSGTHSLTTKPFGKKIDISKLKKFKFDNLYKWAECQSATYNNYTQVHKMKNIEERIKELSKDFK